MAGMAECLIKHNSFQSSSITPRGKLHFSYNTENDETFVWRRQTWYATLTFPIQVRDVYEPVTIIIKVIIVIRIKKNLSIHLILNIVAHLNSEHNENKQM